MRRWTGTGLSASETVRVFPGKGEPVPMESHKTECMVRTCKISRRLWRNFSKKFVKPR